MTKSRRYDVGYRKPPKVSQFKSGRSGNPKGRPKSLGQSGKEARGAVARRGFKGGGDLAATVGKELATKITVTENGSKRKLRKDEVLSKALVNGAIKGETKSIQLLMSALKHQGGEAESETYTSILEVLDTNENHLVMEDIIRRIRECEPTKPTRGAK